MPVVDENNQVVGVANLEDLGYIAVKQKKKAFPEIIIHKPTLVTKDTSLEAIALQMMETQEALGFSYCALYDFGAFFRALL